MTRDHKQSTVPANVLMSLNARMCDHTKTPTLVYMRSVYADKCLFVGGVRRTMLEQ